MTTWFQARPTATAADQLMRSSPVRLALVALVAGLSLAACGQPTASAPISEPVHLDELLYPDAEHSAANFALVEDAVQRCMLGQGFEYRVRVLPPEAAEYRTFPRLETLTIEDARLRGFAFTSLPAAIDDPNRALGDTMSPSTQQEWVEALWQCRPAARESVNGEFEDRITVLRTDYEDLSSEFEALPEVVALEREWVTCMRTAGFDGPFSTFREFAQEYLDAFNRAASSTQGEDLVTRLDELAAEERRAAEAAATCADPLKSSYSELWMTHQIDFLDDRDVPELPQ